MQMVRERTLRSEDDDAAAAAGAPELSGGETGRETMVGEEVLRGRGETEGMPCATGGGPLGGPNATGGGPVGGLYATGGGPVGGLYATGAFEAAGKV